MRARNLPWVALATLAITVPAAAQQNRPDYMITVTGEATVDAAPDSATIEAGVSSRSKTAREASATNNEAMRRVLGALRDGGVADRDIRTEYLSLQPIQDNSRNGMSHVVAFQATNAVSVKVRDIGKIGAVLDRLIAAGANDISGIRFDVSGRSQKLDEARAGAVRDARRKADVLAKAAGVGVGRAIDIVEGGQSTPVMMRAAVATPAPIAPGEQTLRASVRVTFQLMH